MNQMTLHFSIRKTHTQTVGFKSTTQKESAVELIWGDKLSLFEVRSALNVQLGQFLFSVGNCSNFMIHIQ